MDKNTTKSEEKDYFSKEEMTERLKWLTISICALNILITIGIIFLLVYHNPTLLLSSLIGILIGFLGVRFYKKYRKKK